VALPSIVRVLVELLPALAFRVIAFNPIFVLALTFTVTGPAILAALNDVAKLVHEVKFVAVAAAAGSMV
jgi:hypothetical protein